MLRFFADHCVPRSLSEALRAAGHEVTPLAKILPVDSSDERVVAKAVDLGAILLSADGDFADIVAFPPARYAGIVALRRVDDPGKLRAVRERLLADIASNPDAAHFNGRLFVIDAHRIRVWG